MNNFWNERYAQQEYAYGIEPNAYFKSVIDLLSPGKILVPGAGEGRDAVYAAKLGWEVFAFDLSTEGRKKALQLAEKQGVAIRYDIFDAADLPYEGEKFDLIALVFFHLPEQIRPAFHRQLTTMLNENGLIALECFHPKQLQNTSGGPNQLSLLYTPEMLSRDFSGLQQIANAAHTIELNEGLYHVGKADVVRFLGRR